MRTFWGILGAPSSGSGTGNTLDADRLAEETSLALDLIGVEEYDLQQMHQLAMTAEFGGSLPPGVSEEGARLLRERFLILLERRRGAQGVCELGRDRGLFALKLGMWRDEPTIPERYERYCTAERASPTVTPS